jgi:hypothetical protein
MKSHFHNRNLKAGYLPPSPRQIAESAVLEVSQSCASTTSHELIASCLHKLRGKKQLETAEDLPRGARPAS